MPLGGVKLSYLEVARLCQHHGIDVDAGGGQHMVDAIAVAAGESSLYTGAWNFTKATGDESYGLWQINMTGAMGPARRAKYGFHDNGDLFVADNNARVMADMSKLGTDWGPWGAYKGKAYTAALPLARTAREVLRKELGRDAPKPPVTPPVVVPPVKPPVVVPPKPPVVVPPTPPKEVPPVTKPYVWSTVGPGQENNSVKVVQEALIKFKFAIPAGPTGFWGEQTSKAYAAFQKSLGYSGADADGVPGPTSLKALGVKAGFDVKVAAEAPSGTRAPSPVPGHGVTYAYGVRNSRYAAGYHTGDDYAASTGTVVVAVRAGTVQWANGNGGAYGNWIGLKADNGRVYVYCHLSSISVGVGGKVKAGTQLGRVGATGNVTGPHLHFEDHPSGGFVYAQCRKPAW